VFVAAVHTDGASLLVEGILLTLQAGTTLGKCALLASGTKQGRIGHAPHMTRENPGGMGELGANRVG